MKFIRHDDRGYRLDAYLAYLDQIEGRLPPSVREYALASWHYDIKHHQCPHDARLVSMSVDEIPTGKSSRTLEMRARFKGAFNDGFFDFICRDVQSYSLSLDSITRGAISVGHEDWMIDELLLEGSGLTSHEIEFSRTGCWKILCKDITYEWRTNISQ